MNRVAKYIGITTAVLFFLLSGQAHAQFKFSVSADQEYSDNPFRSPAPTASFQSTLNFNTEADLGGINLGYYGSYSSFNEVPERNYYWHQTALFHKFDRAELGLFADQRINKTESEYFNYSGITLYYKKLFNIKDYYISLSPNISYTNYDNIGIINNYKGSFNFSLNHSTGLGITFILGGAVNYKHYTSPNSTAEITYINDDNTTETETISVNNAESLTQIVGFARIAKSLTPTTGAALQLTNRNILNNIPENIKDVNIIYGDESEMFDDPVTYEGNIISLELTQILFEDMVVKGGYYFLNKHYPTQGIYEDIYIYDTAFMRRDEQSIFSLSVSKKIYLGDSEETSLSLQFNYRYINNTSNSYWFNYESNSYNVSAALNF